MCRGAWNAPMTKVIMIEGCGVTSRGSQSDAQDLEQPEFTKELLINMVNGLPEHTN
jgi:hypothetical protein